jgi:hypothetical protein
MNTGTDMGKGTWNFTYLGHTLSECDRDSYFISLPYDPKEAMILARKGIEVGPHLDGVIITKLPTPAPQ